MCVDVSCLSYIVFPIRSKMSLGNIHLNVKGGVSARDI